MKDFEDTSIDPALNSLTGRISSTQPMKLIRLITPDNNARIEAMFQKVENVWLVEMVDYEVLEMRIPASGEKLTGHYHLDYSSGGPHKIGKTQDISNLVERPLVKPVADTSPKAVAEARRKALLGKRGRY